jgi:hypothetical protein
MVNAPPGPSVSVAAAPEADGGGTERGGAAGGGAAGGGRAGGAGGGGAPGSSAQRLGRVRLDRAAAAERRAAAAAVRCAAAASRAAAAVLCSASSLAKNARTSSTPRPTSARGGKKGWPPSGGGGRSSGSVRTRSIHPIVEVREKALRAQSRRTSARSSPTLTGSLPCDAPTNDESAAANATPAEQSSTYASQTTLVGSSPAYGLGKSIVGAVELMERAQPSKRVWKPHEFVVKDEELPQIDEAADRLRERREPVGVEEEVPQFAGSKVDAALRHGS